VSATEGDRGFIAWVTRLVRAHRTELAAIGRAHGLRGEEAFDAVQEAFVTFLKIAHARKLSEEAADSRALLGVLVRNHARNRRRKHDLARAHAGDEAIDQLDSGDLSVDALIARAEAHVAALGCVEKLSEVQQHVVTLRLLEDRPGEVVASMLDTTPGNVAVILNRAKRALRECIAQAE
jgi:RNA polymerase sigma-70 factor (ECF subfamily)